MFTFAQSYEADCLGARKMAILRRILELIEILLAFHTGFSLVSAAVVCAVLESISGLEPSLVILSPGT